MKKILALVLLISGMNMFAAANGRPEMEKTEFFITITNNSGDSLELPYGFLNIPGGTTYTPYNYRMNPNATVKAHPGTHLVEFGFKQKYENAGPNHETMEFAPGAFPKMNGKEDFEIVKKQKSPGYWIKRVGESMPEEADEECQDGSCNIM